MNYPYPSPPASYMHPNMSQAIQAIMLGGQLPHNCLIMAIPLQQAQQILPQLLMNSGLNNGGDPMIYPPQPSYYGPPIQPQNYNYPIVPYKKSKKKSSYPVQPHPNLYNSSSFDTYMEDLSWSRLFDRPSRRTSKQQDSVPKKSRSNSSSTETSTTSDETIRRVNVPNKQTSSNTNSKQQTKGSLPFKYSSEFVPGIDKQQQQQQGKKIKSSDVFIIKKP